MLDRELSNEPFFKLIESTTASARQRLEQTPTIARCLQRQVEMQTYQAFLTEAYHHVKHTVPLLMACGSRLPERLEWLRQAIVHYIDEEVGHQEWILNDLQNLGVDKEQVRGGQASLPTELALGWPEKLLVRLNSVFPTLIGNAISKKLPLIKQYTA